MPGRHNALNATAAIAVAHELKAPVATIRKAIASFGGVKRRFTRTGEWNGVAIFDDYGHHPVEIAAVLRAARAATKGQVIAVVQPHRYTPPAIAVRLLRLVLQRRRHGDRRRRLSRRRSADRRRRQGGARRGDQRPRPPPRHRAALARQARGDRPRDRQARRLSSSSSAPATSPNGPMRCPANWRRWTALGA